MIKTSGIRKSKIEFKMKSTTTGCIKKGMEEIGEKENVKA
jgi:hypothetical protein